MKYKYIYDEDTIDFECGILYGPMLECANYEFELINNSYYCLFGKKIIRYPYTYAQVNENIIYKDIVQYGKRFYEILKNDLCPINHSWYGNREQDKLVNDEIINTNIEKIKPICLDFIKDYGIPIGHNEYDYPSEYYDLFKKSEYNFIPVAVMVRYSLLIFILHTIFSHLDKTIELYPELYRCFLGKQNYGNHNIMVRLFNYINSKNNLFYGYAEYHIKMIRIDDLTFMPIRHSTNLFIFAYETLINNICALSFKEIDEQEQVSEYLTFRKCQKCLKNIYDEPSVARESKRIPTQRFYLCEECRKKAKLLSKRNYEKNKRIKYNEIKAKLPQLKDEQLIYDIKHMKPKDMIRMYELNKLEDRIIKEKGIN